MTKCKATETPAVKYPLFVFDGECGIWLCCKACADSHFESRAQKKKVAGGSK